MEGFHKASHIKRIRCSVNVNNIRDAFVICYTIALTKLIKAIIFVIGACNHVNNFIHSLYSTPILLHTFAITFLLLVRYI